MRFNQWCEYSHHGQCAFAGVYQPSLPTGTDFGNFVLLGNYVDLFNMLGLPETTNVHDMGDAALKVCGDTDVPFPAKDHHTLSQNELCFVAAYAYETFVSGHGFDARVNFTTVTETTYNGATVSVGWQLGAMLYEINALPWSFDAGPNCSWTRILSSMACSFILGRLWAAGRSGTPSSVCWSWCWAWRGRSGGGRRRGCRT